MGQDANPTTAEEIRLGVANSCLKMPKDPEQRRELVQSLFDKGNKLKDRISAAKDEAGVQSHENRLQNVYGVARKTQQILKILNPMKPGDRAAVLAQAGLLSQDMGWCDKDLVTLAEEAEAVAGDAQDEQGAMFDKTGTGARLGGEPKPVEARTDAPPAAEPTPGLSVEEYTRRFQEAHDAWKAKGGRGRRPKALVDAEKDLEEAKRAVAQPIHEQMREASAEGDAFIREQAARSGSPVPDTAHRGDDDDIDDEIPDRGPLAGGAGQGSYTLN